MEKLENDEDSFHFWAVQVEGRGTQKNKERKKKVRCDCNK